MMCAMEPITHIRFIDPADVEPVVARAEPVPIVDMEGARPLRVHPDRVEAMELAAAHRRAKRMDRIVTLLCVLGVLVLVAMWVLR